MKILLALPKYQSFLYQNKLLYSNWRAGRFVLDWRASRVATPFVSETENLSFKSRANQIYPELPTAGLCYGILSEKLTMLPVGAITQKWASSTRYTLRHDYNAG